MRRRAEESPAGVRLAQRATGRAERVASLAVERKVRVGADMSTKWRANEEAGRTALGTGGRAVGDQFQSPSQQPMPDRAKARTCRLRSVLLRTIPSTIMASPALQPIPLPNSAPSAATPIAPEVISPPAPPTHPLMFSPKLSNNLFSSPPLITQPLPDAKPGSVPANPPAEPTAQQPSPPLDPQLRPDPPAQEQPTTAQPAPPTAAPFESVAETAQPSAPPAEAPVEAPAETEPTVAAGAIERQAEEDEIIAEQFSNEYHDSKPPNMRATARLSWTAADVLSLPHSLG